MEVRDTLEDTDGISLGLGDDAEAHVLDLGVSVPCLERLGDVVTDTRIRRGDDEDGAGEASDLGRSSELDLSGLHGTQGLVNREAVSFGHGVILRVAQPS